jgi:phosphate transport system substrate-binding protein
MGLATLVAMPRSERRTVGIRPLPRIVLLLLALAVLAVGAAGCGRDDEDEGNDAQAPATTGETTAEELSGSIEIDGSSTVGPLTTAAAESFRGEQPGVNVTVGVSGTGGGFERFCAGETDISNASRPIDEEEEVPVCEQAGIEYTEFQVGVDALTVVVNPENDWATCLTVDQLKKMWEPAAEGKVNNWNQVDPSFPDQALALAGPGTDSGTFDYFTDEVNGEEGASRADYTASEDDNVIVEAVAGDAGALGYFGFTYFEENEESLKALEVDGGEGCVAPSVETARDGSYAPLSRPLFIYVKNDSLSGKPQVHGFVEYFLTNSIQLAEDALFIPVPDDQVETNLSTLESAGGT